MEIPKFFKCPVLKGVSRCSGKAELEVVNDGEKVSLIFKCEKCGFELTIESY